MFLDYFPIAKSFQVVPGVLVVEDCIHQALDRSIVERTDHSRGVFSSDLLDESHRVVQHEVQVEPLALLGLELGQRALAEEPAFLHDQHLVRQALGLVHGVRGQDHT